MVANLTKLAHCLFGQGLGFPFAERYGLWRNERLVIGLRVDGGIRDQRIMGMNVRGHGHGQGYHSSSTLSGG